MKFSKCQTTLTKYQKYSLKSLIIYRHIYNTFLTRKTLVFYVFCYIINWWLLCPWVLFMLIIYGCWMFGKSYKSFSSYQNSLLNFTTNTMSHWTTYFDDTSIWIQELSVTINLFCYKAWELIENAANSSKDNEYHFF